MEEIGELTKRVTARTLAGIPGVDWKVAKGFREVLSHAYANVDVDVLVDVVSTKLPVLLAAVEERLGRQR